MRCSAQWIIRYSFAKLHPKWSTALEKWRQAFNCGLFTSKLYITYFKVTFHAIPVTGYRILLERMAELSVDDGHVLPHEKATQPLVQAQVFHKSNWIQDSPCLTTNFRPSLKLTQLQLRMSLNGHTHSMLYQAMNEIDICSRVGVCMCVFILCVFLSVLENKS